MRDLSFYGTSAQVIPVLLIALGIEARAFARPRSWPEAIGYIFVAVYAGVAEVLALLAMTKIGGGIRNRVVNQWFVWTAIVVQMAMLTFVAVSSMMIGRKN
jgi:hypothetical protein